MVLYEIVRGLVRYSVDGLGFVGASACLSKSLYRLRGVVYVITGHMGPQKPSLSKESCEEKREKGSF